MKKLLLPTLLIAGTFALSGCSTIFTGMNQEVKVKTHNDAVGSQLDHVATFTVLSDAYRVKHDGLKAEQSIVVHRKNTPIEVQVKESECILPTQEHFNAGIHPAIMLDVLATSPLSTSIDSSTGAAWRYDKTLYVTPKIKDTPACRQWLESMKAKGEYQATGFNEVDQKVNQGSYAHNDKAPLHEVGYEQTFEKAQEAKEANEDKQAEQN